MEFGEKGFSTRNVILLVLPLIMDSRKKENTEKLLQIIDIQALENQPQDGICEWEDNDNYFRHTSFFLTRNCKESSILG